MKCLPSCLLTLLLGFIFSFTVAQKLPNLDKSPLDFAYFPHNYPHDGGKELVARVIYSRPSKNDRKIFGNIIPFGEVWRIGANESTEIEFYKNIKINGKDVEKGAYTLYAIPGEKNWTFIINTARHTWGAYKYNLKDDVVRMEVPVNKTKNSTEALTLMFSDEKGMGQLYMFWDDTEVVLPFEY